ncbi:uncharacterized protein [Pleurodeles waltl]|uniref:uncharacterized protein n=1 Tax=Pleurodeles waltl TaxID=8319 RepID=UPI003709C018
MPLKCLHRFVFQLKKVCVHKELGDTNYHPEATTADSHLTTPTEGTITPNISPKRCANLHLLLLGFTKSRAEKQMQGLCATFEEVLHAQHSLGPQNSIL